MSCHIRKVMSLNRELSQKFASRAGKFLPTPPIFGKEMNANRDGVKAPPFAQRQAVNGAASEA
jgi:hypothetical protein